MWSSSAAGDAPLNPDDRGPNEDNVHALQRTWDVFNDLKSKGLFFDVVLTSKDGVSYPAHRIILCTCGDYFRSLFSGRWRSSNDSEIRMPSVSSGVLSHILDFAYKREVNLSSLDDAKELLVVCDHLGMVEAAQLCKTYVIKHLDCYNCIELWNFARKYNCFSLAESCVCYVTKNIIEVALYKSFVELSVDDVMTILNDDSLNIRKENFEFYLCVRWVRHKEHERLEQLDNLLRCVRLGTMGLDCLERRVLKHRYIIKQQPSRYFVEHVIDGLKRHNRVDDVQSPTYVTERPRHPQSLILVVGGWSNESPTRSSEVYQPRMKRWIPASRCFPNLLRKPRAYHAVVYMGGWVYVIGGFDGETTFNSCERFNVVSGGWEERCGMKHRRCYVGVAMLGGEIYAVGGKGGEQEGDRLKSAEKYHPVLNVWIQLPDMLERRSDAGACSVGRLVFVAGGFTGFQCVSSVEYFDTVSHQWSRVAPMQVPRSGLSVVAYKGSLVVLGGFDGRDRLNSVEVYDVINSRWDVMTSMMTKRSNFCACIMDGSIVVMGGFNSPSTCDVVEYFDDADDVCRNEGVTRLLDGVGHVSDEKRESPLKEKTHMGEWRHLAPMTVSRSALSCCVINELSPSFLFSITSNKQ
uniref:kelch-like protein 10 n=1 Tax=Ciona intestinalis TaxID=7719 RepID=UPI00089DAABE|nr:kelch-like protein 10 [Ciona intestinalis]|eukprot:XP_018670771.1 kelch-like protein 10 [Ciona intestinalis]